MDDGTPGNGLLAVATRGLQRRTAGVDRQSGKAAHVWRTLVLIAAGLALVLAACAPASDSVASQPAATDAASACPIDSFDVFIERFGREIAFQELTTADPLVVEHHDTTAEPEPRRVVEDIALADVVWPVMPRLDLIGGSGRTYDIAQVSDGSMEVQVRTPDTSDQKRYVFGQSPCWQLQRVVDESI